MKEELLKQSNILRASGSGQRIGNNFHQWDFNVGKDTTIGGETLPNIHVDYDYLEVSGIKLDKGRSFSKACEQDNSLSFVINESFARELGFEDPIDKKAAHSLHYKVNALSMVVHEDWSYGKMSAKINGQNVATALEEIENVYDQFVKSFPLEYDFFQFCSFIEK
ncbi:MAG: ABC transporter permease [Bacteroidota bacterium]